ncbi:MAG: HU family DNA-binding protein [Candidatus Marinimicrobia bacterium]|nr:HU family DNA-binding protein [Candidatus Neomarinimicrobiota bacterium]
MTTNELITILAERLECSQVEAKNTLEKTTETFKEIIGKENSFSLPKLGTYSVVKRERRKSYNPSKQVHLMLPVKNVLHFKASTFFKDEVKNWRKK